MLVANIRSKQGEARTSTYWYFLRKNKWEILHDNSGKPIFTLQALQTIHRCSSRYCRLQKSSSGLLAKKYGYKNATSHWRLTLALFLHFFLRETFLKLNWDLIPMKNWKLTCCKLTLYVVKMKPTSQWRKALRRGMGYSPQTKMIYPSIYEGYIH